MLFFHTSLFGSLSNQAKPCLQYFRHQSLLSKFFWVLGAWVDCNDVLSCLVGCMCKNRQDSLVLLTFQIHKASMKTAWNSTWRDMCSIESVHLSPSKSEMIWTEWGLLHLDTWFSYRWEKIKVFSWREGRCITPSCKLHLDGDASSVQNQCKPVLLLSSSTKLSRWRKHFLRLLNLIALPPWHFECMRAACVAMFALHTTKMMTPMTRTLLIWLLILMPNFAPIAVRISELFMSCPVLSSFQCLRIPMECSIWRYRIWMLTERISMVTARTMVLESTWAAEETVSTQLASWTRKMNDLDRKHNE